MSSNPLMMVTKVKILPLSGAACAGGRAASRSLRVQTVGGGLSGLAALISDESALEVCIRDDALYKSTFFQEVSTRSFTFQTNNNVAGRSTSRKVLPASSTARCRRRRR